MDINNNPAMQLVPNLLGEINASRKNQNLRANDPLNPDQGGSASPQAQRFISETEKQQAREQFEQNFQQGFQQQQEKVINDAGYGEQSRAIKAYRAAEETEQADYLSEVLGIDIRV